MIVFTDVSKSFGGRTVIDKASFSITPGEFVCVTGPSGAGKSTIIHLLIRAEAPTGGRIDVDGVDLAKLSPAILQMYRRRMGVLFQDYKLLNDRTLYENVAFALEVCGESDEVIAERVPAVLKRVGLTGREDAFPSQLSGGEKARAGLARALVHKPMIVVADEPTGNIDPRQSMDMLKLLREIHAEGTTVILASHDQLMIDALQTRVLRLEGGKIVRDSVGGYDTGTPVPKPIVRKHEIFDHQRKASGTKPEPVTHTTNGHAHKKNTAAEPEALKPVIEAENPAAPLDAVEQPKAAEPVPVVPAEPGDADQAKKTGRIKPIAI